MKKLLSVILAVLLLFSAIPLTGFAFDIYEDEENILTEGIYSYYIENGEAILIQCDYNTKGEITIPSSFGGAPLTSIYESAFSSCSRITGIVIPEGVREIGSWAFSYCSRLKTVVLPSSLTSFGRYAFSECPKLETVVIPEGITEIPSDCFSGCVDLKNVTLPETLKKINSGAFSGCTDLDNVVIPEGVTFIENDAFVGTDFYDNPANYDEKGVLYLGKHLISAPNTISGDYAVKEGTVRICDYALYNCAELTGITFPESLIEIGYYSFGDCKKLKKISLPSSIEVIDDYAFSGAKALSEINIPDVAVYIGHSVFYDTSYMDNKANFDEDGVMYIGNHIIAVLGEKFARVKDTYTVKEGTLTISGYAFSNYSKEDSDDFYYYDNEDIKEIVLPNSLKIIGEYAFDTLYGLEKITIPDSVISIGCGAFCECYGLEEVKLSASLTEIADELFSGCGNLKKIEIPESVTVIGEGAFEDCGALESLIIPDSVTEIKDYAFEESGLKEIVLSKNIKEIPSCAFVACKNLKEIVIPEGVTSIGDEAFYECTNLENVVLPESLKSIYYYAFSYCSRLQSIVIPASVTYIGGEALSYGLVYDYEGSSVNYYDDRVQNFVIYGVPGTEAETYAVANDIEFISVLGKNGHIHTYISELKKSVDCENGSEKLLTCSSCGENLTVIGSAEGHHYTNKGVCLLCEKACGCMCHKAYNSEFVSFFWNIVNFFNKLFNINRQCECGLYDHY